jgi:D-alanyl-lipoteichoic acid acyltransferase DltB (MBOAT superfamily)
VIEVYKKRQKAEHNFGIYALYVMFFPQLVAGPIERPYNLIHQFYEKHIFEYKRITDGLKLMAWGMFKKAVVADRLAVLVNHVYSAPSDHQGTGLIIATLFFSFQIFCDFSGYSDIAIGSAQVIGFRLMNNFNRPYFAKSISEFWRRWHISLSTWFRDYIYIPLGGKYVSKARLYFNLFITFLISGLWHGASWTFVIWGALNGFYMILESMTSGLRKNIVEKTKINNFPTFHKMLRVGTTFGLVCFGWIFFRAENLPSAIYIITHLFSGFTNILNLGLNKQDLFIAFMLILIMELIHLVQRKGGLRQMISEKPIWIRWALYFALILAILFLRAPEQAPFIYFQF